MSDQKCALRIDREIKAYRKVENIHDVPDLYHLVTGSQKYMFVNLFPLQLDCCVPFTQPSQAFLLSIICIGEILTEDISSRYFFEFG